MIMMFDYDINDEYKNCIIYIFSWLAFSSDGVQLYV